MNLLKAPRSSRVAGLCTLLLVASGSAVQAQTPGRQFINPPGLTKPTGYTHVVVSADHRTPRSVSPGRSRSGKLRLAIPSGNDGFARPLTSIASAGASCASTVI